MPRNSEENTRVRAARKKQILDAALSVYIRFGFHGTDMDAVAQEARLAKGLIYYYYKTKKELFAELYTWMFDEACSFSDTLLENAKELGPIEQLMHYAYGMFGANRDNPRMMQFSIRVPFDAYAIFGPEQWKEGARKSDMHRRALANIIQQGIEQGAIPATDPSSAANSFWSVFVANVFEYAKLITGEQKLPENDADSLRNVVRFCFQGLGVEYGLWDACLDKVIADKQKEGAIE